MDKIDQKRFWSLVDKNDCWIWNGHIGSNGYGYYNDRVAYRIAYTLTFGSCPRSIKHKCGNILCVNPDHLLDFTDVRNRFFLLVDKDGPTPLPKCSDPCWIWRGSININGYGRFAPGGNRTKRIAAHRVSYELLVSPIPNGLLVCHKCDNRRCVNPEHLFLGTITDNIQDMVNKDRHMRGERNGQAVLTSEQVLEIRRKYVKGKYGISRLAKEFGVSKSNIFDIVNRNIWKHLP